MFKAILYLRDASEAVYYFEDRKFKNVYKAAIYSIKHDDDIWTVHIFKLEGGNEKAVAGLIATPVTSEIKDIFLKRKGDPRFWFLGSCFTKKIA